MVDLTVRITGDSRDLQNAAVQATTAMVGFSKSSQAAVSDLQARIDRMVARTRDVNVLGETAGAKESAAAFVTELDKMGAAAQRLKDQYNPLGAAQMKLTSQLAEYQMMATHGYLSTEELGKAQAGARKEYDRTVESVKRHGSALEINRSQQMMYIHSVKSLGEGLASGQNPLTMLVQQGLEFGDALSMGEGGVVGSLTAIGQKLTGVFTPARLLIGGATVAALGLGYAFLQTDKAIEDTGKSLETNKKLTESLRKGYITNLPNKDEPPPPTRVDVLANVDDLKKNKRDTEYELRRMSTRLQSVYETGPDAASPWGPLGSPISGIIDEAMKSRNFGAASERLYQFGAQNNAAQDVKQAQALMTTLEELDRRIKQSETAMSSMATTTETAATRMKDVSDSMTRLHDAIPEVASKLAYFGRISDLQTAARVAAQDASPQKQKEIASDAERAMRAETDKYASENYNKLLRDNKAPGVDNGQIDKLQGDFAKGIAAANEELLRMFPGVKVPVTAGARTFQEQADAYRKDPTLARPGASLYEKGVAASIDVTTLTPMQRAFFDESLKKRGISNPDGRVGHYALEQSAKEQKSDQFQTVFDQGRDADLRAQLLKAQAANANRPGFARNEADLIAQKRIDLERSNVPIDATTSAQINASARQEAAAQSANNYAQMMKSSQDRMRMLEAERQGYGMTAEAQAKLRYQTELLAEADRQGVDIDVQKAAAIDDVAAKMAKIEVETQKAREAQAGLGQAWQGMQGLGTTLIDGMIDHTLNLKTALKAAIPVVIQLISSMAKMQQVNGTTGISFGNPFGGGSGGGLFGTLLGGLFGGKSAGAPVNLAPGGQPDYAGIYHDGGIVGDGRAPMRPIGVIPRYHTGLGIKPDEEFAILQKGERVIPEDHFVDPPRYANTTPFGSQGAIGNVVGMMRGGDTINVGTGTDRRTLNQLSDLLDQRSQSDAREQQRNAGQIQAKWQRDRG